MSYGFEVRNTSNNATITADTNMSQLIGDGTFVIAHGSHSATVTVSGLSNSSLHHVFITENNSGSFGFEPFGVLTKGTNQFTFRRQTFSFSTGGLTNNTSGTMNYQFVAITTA